MHSRVVCRAGGPEAAGPGAEFWGPHPHLWATGRPGQPVGASSPQAGGGAGRAGGHLHGACGGDAGGSAGHPQSRRLLRTPGHGISLRKNHLYVGRHPGQGAPDAAASYGGDAEGGCPDPLCRPGGRRGLGGGHGDARKRCPTGQPGVYPLYVGFNGEAQRGACAPLCGEPPGCETRIIWIFSLGDRIAQASNISFDFATLEIWGALLNGGCLIGLPKDILLSSRDFAAFIQEKRINVMFLTRALFYQFAREVPDAFRSVRDFTMAGEILEPRWVKAVMQHGPPDRLLNGYGPSESTTLATCYLVPDIPQEKKAIPIGRPISNTTVYILDRNLQPVPVGVHGELCIGGDGLAPGYLNRPEQTAEKFIPHPFIQDPHRHLQDGRLGPVFAGRQHRFSGEESPSGEDPRLSHRARGEIEATLLSHAGVENVLVLARGRRAGGQTVGGIYHAIPALLPERRGLLRALSPGPAAKLYDPGLLYVLGEVSPHSQRQGGPGGVAGTGPGPGRVGKSVCGAPGRDGRPVGGGLGSGFGGEAHWIPR